MIKCLNHKITKKADKTVRSYQLKVLQNCRKWQRADGLVHVVLKHNYKKMGNNSFTKRFFFVFLVTLVNLSVFAQQRKVTGTINSATGQALVGVSVAIKGTSKGTTTDANGKFGIDASSN